MDQFAVISLDLYRREILKIRKEICDHYECLILQQFSPEDFENGSELFIESSVIQTVNRRSFDSLVEFCREARQARKENINLELKKGEQNGQ